MAAVLIASPRFTGGDHSELAKEWASSANGFASGSVPQATSRTKPANAFVMAPLLMTARRRGRGSWVCEQLVDEPAERLQRLRPSDGRALHDVAGRRLSNDETRRPAHARGGAIGEPSVYLGRVSARRETRVERRPVEAHRARVLGELRRRECLLMLEQHGVHFPVLALLAVLFQ